jgi:hypothetical protein
MLASWRGTRFEVVQVLREVVDNVLKEPDASDTVLFNRAKVNLIIQSLHKLGDSVVSVVRHYFLLVQYLNLPSLMGPTRSVENWKGDYRPLLCLFLLHLYFAPRQGWSLNQPLVNPNISKCKL